MEQLKLNMIPNGVNPVFHASQYDKGRQIRFVLDETLSSAEVTVSYRAKDGTEYGNVQTSVSGNTITDTIPEEVLTDYGIVEGEVNIDGIGSLNFFVEVEKDAYDGGVITTQTASGPIATFNTNMVEPFKSLKSEINPVQSGTGIPSPQNKRPISGFSALNVTLADGDMQTVESKTVNFGQTVYGCVADVANGKVNVTHKFVTLNGSEAWGSVASGSIYILSLSDMESGTDLDGITNYMQTVHGSEPVDTVSIRFGYNSKVLHVYRANKYLSGVSDLASFKTYLSNNPLEVCYPLATPIEITTTPETVSSIAGVNNIFMDTGNITEIAYFENAEDNLIKLIKACQI